MLCEKCGRSDCVCRLDKELIRANARQVGGDHYTSTSGECPRCGAKLQHWDLVSMFHWDYFQGQVIKYLMRWRKKNGVEDLKKSRHYLDKYIELEDKKTPRPLGSRGLRGNGAIPPRAGSARHGARSFISKSDEREAK